MHTFSPAPQAILLDIEGTTTPIDFVTQTLFPYARAQLATFLASHRNTPELNAVLAGLRALHATETAAPPYPSDSADPALSLPYLLFLMDQDRKVTPLKTLQGLIWQDGYASGALQGAVYADVLPALQRWQAAGRRVAIYSSGSIQAQQLLFRHSTAGDLTPFLSGYFDTTTGPKQGAASYQAIADNLRLPPALVLFLSDHPAEVAAARTAGLQALQVMRPPASVLPDSIGDFTSL